MYYSFLVFSFLNLLTYEYLVHSTSNIKIRKRLINELCFLVYSIQAPMLVPGLQDKEITKIASHADGKHYLALSVEGDVFSWGNGDGGKLGHGDNR